MAEIVTIEGQEFKKRSPWGAWGLVFLTIGVYLFVWYYKINDEARRYLRDDTIKPVLSVLAMFVPIVNFVSIYRTGDRIVRMENNVGIQKSVEPILGLVAAYIAALHIPYYQSHLNKVWELYQGGSAPPAPMAPTGQPASIPPPPPL